MFGILKQIHSVAERGLHVVRTAVSRWTKRIARPPAFGTLADLARSKPQLIAENLLLRQQLIVLNRSVRGPRFTPADRGLFVLLASKLQTWKEALLIIKPETVLRWHREGFRLFWKWKSRATESEPKFPVETITLIRELARDNRLWGAERIRGELLKLGIKVAKRTVQRYMRLARPPRPRGQSWATFLRNHANDILACDFLQVHDVFFRPLFAFIMTELGSRRIVHIGVTRSPTDEWVAQQLREATPFGIAPKYLNPRQRREVWSALRGCCSGKRHRGAAHTDQGATRECMDHLLVVSKAHLRRVLNSMSGTSTARPHQGIGQRIPEPQESAALGESGTVIAFPVPGGSHHDYRRAA